MADNGWASIGHVPKEVKCPKCGEDNARMVEFITKIHGHTSRNPWIFCNCCGKESELPRQTISDK